MRRALIDAATFAVLGGIAAGAVVAFSPQYTSYAVDAYLLYLGGLALWTVTKLTRELASSPGTSAVEESVRTRRRRRRKPAERKQLPELARVERELALATVGAFDLHVRLRPTVYAIAEHRLRSRHGVWLEEEPQRARELLGEPTWDLVRPDRELPDDRHAPGLPLRELRTIVDSLERL